ncbi:hypothetical protein [Pseudomonas sp. MWU16-30317]|uniref:hypothetical protein n=1 Tax=Pseudomonas sp. MWU16-30317 TaxID=2878095 RepID=UPI001CF93A76|nr:hypothetical protein [Pseudomonas sp. MWU16-30317]
MSKRKPRLWPVFKVPVSIGLLSAAGLFAALLGDGAWDTLSWVGLGLPAWLGLRGLLVRRGPMPPHKH